MVTEWGSLTDILARLEAMDEDVRDIAEDIAAACPSPGVRTLCDEIRCAVGELRQIVELDRAKAVGLQVSGTSSAHRHGHGRGA